MKNSKAILFSAVMIVLFSITLIGGCKKKEDDTTTSAAHPLKNFIGTYTVSYHAHSDTPGVPWPYNICDSTTTLVITLDTVPSDIGRLQLSVDTSKIFCSTKHYFPWCFVATKNSSGDLDGNNFLEWCDGNSGHVNVTSSSLSVTGSSAISGSVYYTEWVFGALY